MYKYHNYFIFGNSNTYVAINESGIETFIEWLPAGRGVALDFAPYVSGDIAPHSTFVFPKTLTGATRAYSPTGVGPLSREIAVAGARDALTEAVALVVIEGWAPKFCDDTETEPSNDLAAAIRADPWIDNRVRVTAPDFLDPYVLKPTSITHTIASPEHAATVSPLSAQRLDNIAYLARTSPCNSSPAGKKPCQPPLRQSPRRLVRPTSGDALPRVAGSVRHALQASPDRYNRSVSVSVRRDHVALRRAATTPSAAVYASPTQGADGGLAICGRATAVAQFADIHPQRVRRLHVHGY